LYNNNQSAITHTKYQYLYKSSMYIDIYYYLICNLVGNELAAMEYALTMKMITDRLIEPLECIVFY
jgi:hypothetical protein